MTGLDHPSLGPRRNLTNASATTASSPRNSSPATLDAARREARPRDRPAAWPPSRKRDRTLAKAAGCSREYIRQLEAGTSDPTVGMLQRLAKHLGVPVTALLE